MPPILTSPIPRWQTRWVPESQPRILFGASLPGSAAISETSFTINVWDDCWPIEQCHAVMSEFVAASRSSLQALGLGASPSDPGSGASPRVPTERLLAASDIVMEAFPHLVACGVPVTIGWRAMASAMHAIDRCGQAPHCARHWPAQKLALAFLVGALKLEWIDETGKAPSLANLPATITALQQRFGVASEPASRLELDAVFLRAHLSGDDELP